MFWFSSLSFNSNWGDEFEKFWINEIGEEVKFWVFLLLTEFSFDCENDENSGELKSSFIDDKELSFLLLFIEDIEEIEEKEPSDLKIEGGNIGVDERIGTVVDGWGEMATGVEVHIGDDEAEITGDETISVFVLILNDLYTGI